MAASASSYAPASRGDDLGRGQESADEGGASPAVAGRSAEAHSPPRRALVAGAVGGLGLLATLAARARLGGGVHMSASPARAHLLQLQATDESLNNPEDVAAVDAPPPVCPGGIDVPGEGYVNLVNAKINTPGDAAKLVEVQGDAILTWLGGRTYFAETCSEESYDSVEYKAMPLLGRSIKYTVDLYGAACGCNVAVYLTSMAQNTLKSDCGDYYCDANKVCGAACSEIDVQEANLHSWRSTLHLADDGVGVGAGWGGTGPHARSWSAADYGPEGRCVATTQPFEVEVGFPVDSNGYLKAMQVILSQDGKPCKISATIDSYAFAGRNGVAELSQALAAGMTPIVSYWSSISLDWLDGTRPDAAERTEGVCEVDTPQDCPEFVKVWGFSVFDGISEPPATTTTTPAPVAQVATQPANVVAFQGQAAAPKPEPAMQVVDGTEWIQVNRDGQVYFYNQKSGVTAWNLPAGAAR